MPNRPGSAIRPCHLYSNSAFRAPLFRESLFESALGRSATPPQETIEFAAKPHRKVVINLGHDFNVIAKRVCSLKTEDYDQFKLLGVHLIATLSFIIFLAECPSRLFAQGFTHGIASGDPTANSLTLWSRYQHAESKSVKLTWEIASDRSFSDIIRMGIVAADPEHDYCVNVRAAGLQPGSTYYYRFRNNVEASAVGQSKTLAAECDRVRIAVVNCAKFEGGYYHAYRDIANRSDIDVVIHLGDYIYDNGTASSGSSYYPSVLATGRRHSPSHHCQTLEDYRTRYAQYRADKDLQALHARHPMIVIWDDHDIAAIPQEKLASGLPDYDSDWKPRFQASLKAWHEWIPSKVPHGEPIYRSFQVGSLVNLLMLDTRVCCKSRVTKTPASLDNPDRHIVGPKQLEWMLGEIDKHQSTWNVIGNQLLFAKKDMGWNRWTGFNSDRNRVLEFVKQRPALNLILVTGNAHNPHHYSVRDAGDQLLFHELLPGSVSSGNRAEKALFDAVKLAESDQRMKQIRDLIWHENNAHGYILLDATAERLVANWIFVSDIRRRDFTTTIGRTITIPSRRIESKQP